MLTKGWRKPQPMLLVCRRAHEQLSEGQPCRGQVERAEASAGQRLRRFTEGDRLELRSRANWAVAGSCRRPARRARPARRFMHGLCPPLSPRLAHPPCRATLRRSNG